VMVNSDGLQKGMKTVLQEGGVDTVGMSASRMRNRLSAISGKFYVNPVRNNKKHSEFLEIEFN